MKPSRGKHKASKFVVEDFVSSMPDSLVTNILDRLPIQDAVRTCILSRNWRFKWTTLSRLVFDRNFFMYLSKTKGEKDYGSIISRLLCRINGAIIKFVLYIDNSCKSVRAKDISQWILLLSKKGIKDLSLEKKMFETPLKLPTNLFSCLELKHLKLFNCVLVQPASFHGFPNLLSLRLRKVEYESGKFGEFFAQSHLLQSLYLGDGFRGGNMKLVEITKFVNLKTLSLSLCNLDDTLTKSSSFIFELVGCLPKLRKLALDFLNVEFTEDGAKTRFPTTFPSLRILELSDIELDVGIMLSCAFEMIRSFPNLQTLRIIPCDDDPPSAHAEVDYNTVWLLRLRTVVFEYATTSENEVCLIKYLLARSPSLKKIIFRPACSYTSAEEKLMFAKKLLKLHRASPVVDINLD